MSKKGKEKDIRYKERQKQLRKDIFGDRCFICGYEKILIIHKKNGEKHKKISEMGLSEIRSQNVDDFVTLCLHCHRGVHWCMKYLSFSWDDILLHLTK